MEDRSCRSSPVCCRSEGLLLDPVVGRIDLADLVLYIADLVLYLADLVLYVADLEVWH